MGKSSRIHGSSFRATKRLMNSVFHEGWAVRTTFVPSVRMILSGSAKKKVRAIPIQVRIKKAIYNVGTSSRCNVLADFMVLT